MKKYVFALSVCLGLGSLMAQPLAGHLYLNGVIGFNGASTSTKEVLAPSEPKTTGFQFAPAVGYTFKDNVVIGVRLGFIGSKTTTKNYNITGFDPNTGDPIFEEAGETENKSSITGFGVFGRYYIPIGDGNKFFFYPDVNIAFLTTGSEATTAAVTVENPSTKTFAVGVIPGFAYYPTTHWGIELNVGFLGLTSSNTKNEQVTPNTETRLTTYGFLLSGYTVGVGVSYLLQLGGS